MSYSTQGNGSVGGGGGGSKDGAFLNAIRKTFDSQEGTGMVIGKNGAPAHSMYHMAGDTNTALQGALVAAFNGMLRNTPTKRVNTLLNNVLQESRVAGGTFEAGAVSDLFVIWAHCRDRNDGKGERLVSYYIFIWLYTQFPETVQSLLSFYPELGYWKDLSQMYQILYNTNNTSELMGQIVALFANQLRKDYTALTDALSNGKDSSKVQISLCAKYVPKEGRSFDKKTKITKRIVSLLYPEEFKRDFRTAMKKFRKMYVVLNKHLDTVEIKECSGQWSKIDFNRVPGRALNIKRKAYLNVKGKKNEMRCVDSADRLQCREHFQEHLNRAVNGKISIKGKTMFIHELVGQIIDGKLHTQEERILVEAQWNTHVEAFRKKMEETNSALGKGVCLVDTSGSMAGVPIRVAIAMGLFASSFAHPAFRDCFISFETEPHWIRLTYPRTYAEYQNLYGPRGGNVYYGQSGYATPTSQKIFGEWDPSRAGGQLTLFEKVAVAQNSPWAGSTDFVAAHELILKSCVEAKLQAEEMPEWLMILSDMQFNSANCQYGKYTYLNRFMSGSGYTFRKAKQSQSQSQSYSYYQQCISNPWSTIHENLGRAYHKAGIDACGKPYEVPQQIYWNLKGNTVGFPVQSDTPNTQMISGFNVGLLKLFLTECDTGKFNQKEKKVKTPWDTFRRAVDSETYYPIRKLCSESQERVLVNYTFSEPVKVDEDEDEYDFVNM